jgi:hypothetical protein
MDWMDGWIGWIGRMDGWMDGWMDGFALGLSPYGPDAPRPYRRTLCAP